MELHSRLLIVFRTERASVCEIWLELRIMGAISSWSNVIFVLVHKPDELLLARCLLRAEAEAAKLFLVSDCEVAEILKIPGYRLA
jgi:hypothetical protein